MSSNSSNVDGGGVWSGSQGTVTLTESTISGNAAAQRGGGIYGEAVTLIRSTLIGNSAHRGGGVYSGGWPYFTTSITVIDSTIADNDATGDGGGINNQINASTTITGSSVVANSSGSAGGGIVNVGGSVIVSDSFLDGNEAGFGGGLYNAADVFTIGLHFPTTASLSDVTVTNNSATYNGGGIYNNGTLDQTNVSFGGNIEALNNRSQIVGFSTKSGEQHAVLWTLRSG